jgi:hypothetical protein
VLVSFVHLDGTPMTVDLVNEKASRLFGADLKRPLVGIIKGRVIATGVTIVNDYGKSLSIKSTTTYTEVQKFLGYEFDLTNDLYVSDPVQQVEFVYADEVLSAFITNPNLPRSYRSLDYTSKIEKSGHSIFTAELFKTHEGYKNLWYDVGYSMAGKGTLEKMVTSEDIANDVDSYYYKIYNPLKESFKVLFRENIYNRRALRTSLKSMFLQSWLSTDNIQLVGDSGKSLEKFREAGIKIFDAQFPVDMFDSAQSWSVTIDQRIGMVINDYIMREYLRLDEEGITPEIFHERLQDFLYDMGVDSGPSLMTLNYIELQKEVLSGKTRTAFLLAFSEIFFPVNKEEKLDRKSLGNLKGATTFFGWIQENLHFYGKYSERVNSKMVESDFEFQLYKMMEWSPQTPVRSAASDYNTGILQGRQSEARLEWNNNIETSKLPYIPTKGREMDMISLLFEALSFTSHIKTQREYTGKGITERIKSVVGDYWGSIIADNEMFSIIGTSQEKSSGVFRDHEADIATTLNFIGNFDDRRAISIEVAEKLLSIKDMSEFKSPIDLNLFYRLTALINSEFEGNLRFDHNDVRDLFSSSDFEKEFWKEVKSAYGTEKFNVVFKNNNNMLLSFYNVMKNLFSDSTNFDKLIQKAQGSNKYNLVWENEVASYLLAQDSQGKTILLSEDILPQNIKTLDTNNNWISLPSEYTFSEVHLIVSGDNSEIGVIPLSTVIGWNGQIPQGVYIGCLGKTSAIICDPNGNLLNGVISLDTDTRQFVLDESWYYDQVADNIIDPSDSDDPNGVFILDNAYRTLFLSTGSHLSLMFQKQTVNFVPIEPFKPLFPGTTIQKSAISILRVYSRQIKLKESISIHIVNDIQFLLPVINEIIYSLQKSLRDGSNIDISHNQISVTDRLFQLHDPEVDISHIESVLKMLEPRTGESFYDPINSESWLREITHFSLTDDIAKLQYNNIDSFRLRNNILKLLQNVLARGSSDSSYQFFEKILGKDTFKSLEGEIFQGEQYGAPIIDKASNIDESILLEKIDSILLRMFSYMGVVLLKQGLMTFSKESGDYDIIPMTHNYHTLYEFASKFQIRGLRKQEDSSIHIDRFKYQDRFLNHLISTIVSGHSERITTVDINGIINSEFRFIKNIPYNSPFLKGLFENVDLSKANDHHFIRNEFIMSFYNTYSEEFHQSRMFFEGRLVLKDKITNMLYDQISFSRIASEFKNEIENMLLQAKDRLDSPITPQEEIELRKEQIGIKREQVIRLLTDHYVKILLNPQRQPRKAHPTSSGDIVKYMKDLLKDPTINSVPIMFPGNTKGHSFYNRFSLIFSLDYFTLSDLSKLMPTLAYTYTGTFTIEKGIRLKNIDTIKNLFNSKLAFSQIKESIGVTYNLLYEYFLAYLTDSDINTFTIEYLKELPLGFHSESKLGQSNWKWIDNNFIANDMKQELANVFQTFKIKDDTGQIIESELRKMIGNIIYYVNHYDSNARVLEGDSYRKNTPCALALSPFALLEDKYFVGTYSQKFGYRELSQKAKEIYYTFIPSISQFNFAETYGIINAQVDKIASYLFQEGNQDQMRDNYEIYLRLIAHDNIQIIQNLGYISQ